MVCAQFPTKNGAHVKILFKTRAGGFYLLGIKYLSFVPNKTRHASVLNGFKNICIIKPNLYIKIFI